MHLNQQQEEAANHRDGPCLVTAVPGSGKTRLLVERVGRMIESGIPAHRIVCVTFTNKAADEMKERICKRLNQSSPACFIGTFHKLCVRLLRKFGDRIGYSEKFTIADADDQIDLITQIARRHSITLDRKETRPLAKAINDWRENMWSEEDFFEAIGENKDWATIAELYLDTLKSNNMIDFSGLLSETIRLLNSEKEVLDRVQEAFQYVQVDEVQDTNYAQFVLINMFTGKWNNVLMVGDISQCVTEDTIVYTENGEKLAIDIEVGDKVLSAIGSGRTDYCEVTRKHIADLPYGGYKNCINIRTKSGKSLSMTPDHIVFAGFSKYSSSLFIVYLMFDNQLGYRVGITNTKRKHGLNNFGIGSRLNQERADRMYVLKAVTSKEEARYWEQYFSITYGLPTWTFDEKYYAGSGVNYVQKLYGEVDTIAAARRLLMFLGYDEKYPHYTPKCMSRSKRRNFSITLCGDNRGKPLHKYSISGSEISDKQKLKEAGFNVRSTKKGCKGWRIEGSTADPSRLQTILLTVQKFIDVNVIEKASFGDVSLPFLPASNLLQGMSIYVLGDSGEIEIDEIVSINCMAVNLRFVDLDIDRTCNFIGNGIVSHNSIYKFRGARYQNIKDFLAKHEGCRIIELPVNYRSTPQIVKAADKLIRYNSSHMGEKFETVNPDGEDVKLLPFKNQLDEADFVARHCRKLIDNGWDAGDLVVLYRMNAMSEPIERAMSKYQVGYTVVGGRSFFDRKEIKDCISMLRFVANPRDGVAFHRCAKLLPGVGDTTVGKIETIAIDEDINIIEASQRFIEEVKLSKIKSAVENAVDKFNFDHASMNVAQVLEALIDRFDYYNLLEKEYDQDDAFDRIDNVRQMLNSAADFATENPKDSVVKYLQMIALVTANDKKSEGKTVSLMTLHAAKGLEFPIVFMIGVEQDILPHSLAVADDPLEGLEEERRLCYVGMTRAKTLLYVSHCYARRQFGKGGQVWHKKCKPSQFLQESDLLKPHEAIRL